jgi:hypothetical protein
MAAPVCMIWYRMRFAGCPSRQSGIQLSQPIEYGKVVNTDAKSAKGSRTLGRGSER